MLSSASDTPAASMMKSNHASLSFFPRSFIVFAKFVSFSIPRPSSWRAKSEGEMSLTLEKGTVRVVNVKDCFHSWKYCFIFLLLEVREESVARSSSHSSRQILIDFSRYGHSYLHGCKSTKSMYSKDREPPEYTISKKFNWSHHEILFVNDPILLTVCFLHEFLHCDFVIFISEYIYFLNHLPTKDQFFMFNCNYNSLLPSLYCGQSGFYVVHSGKYWGACLWFLQPFVFFIILSPSCRISVITCFQLEYKITIFEWNMCYLVFTEGT